jgi:CelD/BcsL family acetyltransferase involved in cellulose biosynthesis
MESLRGAWEMLSARPDYTIFQRFDFNLLAATIFVDKQPPLLVMAESDSGIAIIPACIDLQARRLTLLGEELFDYRCPLAQGDATVLKHGWHTLLEFAVESGLGFGFHALREDHRSLIEVCDLPLTSFSSAPHIFSSDREAFHHPRLALNLRRLQRQGVNLKKSDGAGSVLIREIYRRKSLEPGSLFTEPRRIEMATAMAERAGQACEIFILEQGTDLVAALVTFRDRQWRRFYTTYYDHKCAKQSPGLTLLHQVTRQSLKEGLHCDFMTGDQPYKRRLANGSTPLWRIALSADQLRLMVEQSLEQAA